jgi:hypothetical protein
MYGPNFVNNLETINSYPVYHRDQTHMTQAVEIPDITVEREWGVLLQ